ncbi:diguanylate cyclase domain-containing protein [Desulfoplanes formicivorans]|uniref:Diguanylate cyclase n=1 Tax=Desulfoplanes formicivorans TaxID=1592317 RepID=A0A194AF73_9BACT|nr:diguanylate cyclase [Desulfoplanes formicivorans]GAU07741.1 diguanylate cyclase [Desulfoplanes formicivorans]
MHLPTIFLPWDRSPLTGKDLIAYEPQLASCFKRCFAFQTHALRFPTSIPGSMLPEKEGMALRAFMEHDRVHIPLQADDRLLGIFVAGGIDEKDLTPLLATLPNIAAMALETVRLYKATLTDPLTGLYNHFFLQALLETEIATILSSILPGPDSSADTEYRGCFGLIHLDMDRFAVINSRFGHCFGDKLLGKVGRALQAQCPSQAHVCRTTGAAFIVFWPQGTPTRCKNLAHKLVETIASLPLEGPISRETFTLTGSAGVATYPADMQGNQFRRPAEEQARIILEKAHKATRSAKMAGGDTIFSYKDILKQGATILETLPLNRVVINAGNDLDLTEGTRFLVWPQAAGNPSVPASNQDMLYPDMYKGEILVQEVREQTSVGEILFLNDPSWSPRPGDRLSLADHQEPQTLPREQSDKDSPKQDKSCLLNLRDFIRAWTRIRTSTSAFVIALCQMSPLTASSGVQDGGPEERLAHVHKALCATFPGEHLMGRYSANTLICCFPDLDADSALAQGQKLCTEYGETTRIDLRMGMAGYPFLHCAKSEILDNARKALDHALLLPAAGAVLFDSISLTISADRMFTKGDFYSALEEYQRALVIDPANLLARNSLGICYARLGRMAEAKQHFKTVVEQGGKDLMPLYNFGCACFKTGDQQAARKAFAECLTIDPSHVYSLIRLGQLAEKDGDVQAAEHHYLKAGETEQGKGMAARHLAKLAMDRGEQDKAREFLHQALVFDPNDAFALNMLAKLYLDRGEDPEIAENLARQSVHLRPDIPAMWIEVARALETRGKKDEARTAHLRSRSRH